MSENKREISQYPNPQLERADWLSLNGQWDCGYKKARLRYKFIEEEQGIINFYKSAKFTDEITVPFCVESELSGIGYKDFLNAVWYRKTVDIKPTDGRVFLRIGAADYYTSLIVNGVYVGSHKGGYTSFSFDITEFVNSGENELFILCQDDTRSPLIPSGKQSNRKKSYACSYTRTTGIWQSVYLEYVPTNYVESFKIYPDLDNQSVSIRLELGGCEDLSCTAFYDGRQVANAQVKNAQNSVTLELKLSEKHIWELGSGELYDLVITFGEDKVKSYFGLRSVTLDGFKFMLNGKSVFQRLVLDQGFYRKGIYTAQNDDELVRDIDLSMALGFNGARLHQKVFDPRFLYFCDLRGYMVWGEYANWGIDYSNALNVQIFNDEWCDAVERDFNHPSIIGWCPFNETWDYKHRRQYDPLISVTYDTTKAIDPTRPCIDTSGNFHVRTDIYDVHDYRCNVDEFKASFDKLVTDGELYEHVLLDNPGRQKYNGEPVFVSEYGGIKWAADKEYKSWGYGDDVKTPEEFAQRYCGLTDALVNNEKMLGFCYTQLYDVEQEQNGLYTYDRQTKFSQEIYDKIIASNTRLAAIEK